MKIKLLKILIFLAFSFDFLHSEHILVAHGFGDIASNAVEWLKQMYPRNIRFESFCQSSSKSIVPVEFEDRGNILNSHLGQGEDIKKLQSAVDNKLKNIPFIGIGHSRGGAALISYVGQHNPENMKALVIRGTPSSLPDVGSDKIGGWIGSEILAKIVLKCISFYPLNDLTPKQAISKIKNKEMLVVIMHSKNDSLVDNYHGRVLYDEFKSNGFNNLYWIEMDNHDHNDCLSEKTENILSSIYEKHNISTSSYKSAKQFNIEALKDELQPEIKLYEAPSFFRKGNIIPAAIIAGVIYYGYKKYYELQDQTC
jgi:predicted esterase